MSALSGQKGNRTSCYRFQKDGYECLRELAVRASLTQTTNFFVSWYTEEIVGVPGGSYCFQQLTPL